MLVNLIDDIVDRTPPKVLASVLKYIPRAVFDWKNKTSFGDTVRYAYKHSAFYRKRFQELNIDPARVRAPSDLDDFFTNSIDIIESAEDFLCRAPDIVFESSGTTGKNKRIYLSHDELDDIGHIMAVGLYLGGLTKDDRLVNALDFNIWIPGMITHKCLEKSGLFGIDAGKIDPMEVYKRIPIYKFNVIMGEPTWLIKLTEIAEEKGSYPLKLIVGGAEDMPPAARPWMEKVWQGAQVRMVYASVESAGIMAFEPSSECDGYHIDENNFTVEVMNPDKDGYGEVVFTTLARRTMPLIRYRNRDISKIIDEKCSCGLPFRRLAKLRGRADEMVVASGGNLYPLMFSNILKDIEGITSDWQIEIKLKGIKEVMEFNLESSEVGPKEKIKEKIFDNIKERYPDLWKNLSLGIFDTEFIYHAPNTLRTKTKLLRLVDKRYAK